LLCIFFGEIARFSDNFMRFPKTINKKLDKQSPKKRSAGKKNINLFKKMESTVSTERIFKTKSLSITIPENQIIVILHSYSYSSVLFEGISFDILNASNIHLKKGSSRGTARSIVQ
jgi:hypothetical protein